MVLLLLIWVLFVLNVVNNAGIQTKNENLRSNWVHLWEQRVFLMLLNQHSHPLIITKMVHNYGKRILGRKDAKAKSKGDLMACQWVEHSF